MKQYSCVFTIIFIYYLMDNLRQNKVRQYACSCHDPYILICIWIVVLATPPSAVVMIVEGSVALRAIV